MTAGFQVIEPQPSLFTGPVPPVQPGNDQMWPGIGVQETVPCHCRHGQVTRFEGRSSLSSRCSSRLTLVRCHLPPHAIGISLSFNSRVMALMETKPAFRRLRIVGAKASARTSAGLFSASPLASLPASSLRRFSTLNTLVRCQLPP